MMMVPAPAHLRIEEPVAGVLQGMMNIHALGTKHTFIDRMIFVTLNGEPVSAVLPYNDTAAHAAITTRCFKFHFSFSSVLLRPLRRARNYFSIHFCHATDS